MIEYCDNIRPTVNDDQKLTLEEYEKVKQEEDFNKFIINNKIRPDQFKKRKIFAKVEKPVDF